MTQEEQNRISASFYRQMFYLRMLNIEHDYFLKNTGHSGIKNVLFRLKSGHNAAMNQLKSYLPNSRKKVDEIMNESDEKIQAMANIIEKISMLETDLVLKLEDDFNELITVQY